MGGQGEGETPGRYSAPPQPRTKPPLASGPPLSPRSAARPHRDAAAGPSATALRARRAPGRGGATPEEGKRPRAGPDPAPARGGGTWVLPRLHHPAAAAERRSGARRGVRRGERLCGPADGRGAERGPRRRRRRAPRRAARDGVRPRAPPGSASAARALRAPAFPLAAAPASESGGKPSKSYAFVAARKRVASSPVEKQHLGSTAVRGREAGIRPLSCSSLFELFYEQTGRTAHKSAPRQTCASLSVLLPRSISVVGSKPQYLKTH